MPADIAHSDEFIRENHIRYFVFRSSVTPTEIDRLGKEHVDLAYQIYNELLPRSRLLMTDPFGWSLYEIGS